MGDDFNMEDFCAGACCAKVCCSSSSCSVLLLTGALSSLEMKAVASVLLPTTDSQARQGYILRQIANYQKNISPKLVEQNQGKPICRFTPSCSEYAKQAVERYGSLKGGLMAAARLLRCNPFSKGGYDPVE